MNKSPDKSFSNEIINWDKQEVVQVFFRTIF